MSDTNGTPTPPQGGSGTAPPHNIPGLPPGLNVPMPQTQQEWKAFEAAVSLVNATSLSRQEFFNRFFDGRNNIDRECGYPPTNALMAEQYRELYDREPLATRAVELMPKECWQKPPKVYENSKESVDTEFEKAWAELGRSLTPETSWYQDQEGSAIWEYLYRADKLSGIGFFGVILIGLDDGLNLDQPAAGVMTVANTQFSRPEIASYAVNRAVRLTKTEEMPGIVAGQDAVDTLRGLGKAWLEVIEDEKKHIEGDRKVIANIRDKLLEEEQQQVDNASLLTLVKAAAKSLDRSGAMPGYGQVYLNRDGRVWYVGGDGDARDYPKYVRDHFSTVPGVKEVVYESEVQPRATGWTLIANYRVLAKDVAKDDSQYPSSFAGAQGTDAQYVGVQLSPPEFPSESPNPRKRKVLFLRCYPEDQVQIVQYEADVRNPRFGLPVMYRITLNDPREVHSGIGLPLATVRVHWSRVVHLADNRNSSEIFGVPRMRPILNRVLDSRKVYGGAGEGYWKSCITGLALKTNPQAGGDVQINQGDVRKSMDSYYAGLQRWILAENLDVATLAPTPVDPTPYITIIIESICIQLACPVRVFKGAERGELASSQDDEDWNNRVMGRNTGYLTPRVIVLFIDRLISLGCLPVPKKGKTKVDNYRPGAIYRLKPLRDKQGNVVGTYNQQVGVKTTAGYSIEWPDLDAMSDADKAKVGLTKMQTLQAYVAGGIESILPPENMYVDFLGYNEDQAASLVEEAEAHQAEAMTMPAEGEAGHPTTPLDQQGTEQEGKPAASGFPDNNTGDTGDSGSTADDMAWEDEEDQDSPDRDELESSSAVTGNVASEVEKPLWENEQ